MSVGGGLDRLQAEEDPMIRFDPVTKLWVNLHHKRTVDDPRLQFNNIINGNVSKCTTALASTAPSTAVVSPEKTEN